MAAGNVSFLKVHFLFLSSNHHDFKFRLVKRIMPNWKKTLENAKFRIVIFCDGQTLEYKEIEEFSDSLDFRKSIFQLVFYLRKNRKLVVIVAGNPIVQQQLPRNSEGLREIVISAIEKEEGDWIEEFILESEETFEMDRNWRMVKKELEPTK